MQRLAGTGSLFISEGAGCCAYRGGEGEDWSSLLPPSGGCAAEQRPEIQAAALLKWVFFCLQCWENGIILCRELADQYESYYDYRNLSKMRVGFQNKTKFSTSTIIHLSFI